MAYRTSTIKRGRAQKLGSSKGTIAISLARKKNDPLYQKMIRYKGLYKTTKNQIEKKYASKSRTLAMQKAMGYKYEACDIKLYHLFLLEQNWMKEIGQEAIKKLAETQKNKIQNSCELRFKFQKGRRAQLEKSLCKLNGKVAYLQILINGIKAKIENCTTYTCRVKANMIIAKAQFVLKAIANKANKLRQQIQNTKGV